MTTLRFKQGICLLSNAGAPTLGAGHEAGAGEDGLNGQPRRLDERAGRQRPLRAAHQEQHQRLRMHAQIACPQLRSAAK
jgi:hypothetical protein